MMDWYERLQSRVRMTRRRKGAYMLKRLAVAVGVRLLRAGLPDAKVIREDRLRHIYDAATRLRGYAERSGALQEEHRVNAYYVVHREASIILTELTGAEVMP